MPDATAIEAGIGRVTQMAVDLRIPRLGTLGLTPQNIPELAALARRASSMRYNPVVLSDDALVKILVTCALSLVRDSCTLRSP